jgi:hypothetical protein
MAPALVSAAAVCKDLPSLVSRKYPEKTSGSRNYRAGCGPSHAEGSMGLVRPDGRVSRWPLRRVCSFGAAVALTLSLAAPLSAAASAPDTPPDSEDLGGGGCDRDGNVITGGRGNDRCHGTDEADYMYAGKGRDTFFGRKGGDRIVGGLGFDRLSGERGNDSIEDSARGADRDIVCGGRGGDGIDVSDDDGRDVVYGGAGRDGVSMDGGDRLRRGPCPF